MSSADDAETQSAKISEISGKQKTIYLQQITQINAETKSAGN